MLFFGLHGIPLGPPKPVPLTVVIGKHIPVKKIAEPTQEQIETLHMQFLVAVEKVYNDNKDQYGMADIPLKIV